MEDLDAVDYSSDRLESSDIWDVPGGGLMEQGVDIPRMGQEDLESTCLVPLRLEDVTSPPDFLVFSSVEQFPVESHADSFSQLPADLLGSPSWREAGVFFSRNLGFSTPGFQGGFEVVEGFEQVAADGVAGQVLQGKGSSG